MGDGRRFVEDPPLLTHVEECHPGWVEEILGRYRATMSDERRQLLARFRARTPPARSSGSAASAPAAMSCCCSGTDHDDPLLLQVKQATASVLEPHAGRSRYRHAGRRVVTGQRLLQTASDIFLGWTSDGAADYYVRQLWDMKGSVNLDTLDPADLAPYGRLCGWVLARAHARSGDAAAISGYLGGGRQLRPGGGQLRRGLRRPDRGRLRRVHPRPGSGVAGWGPGRPSGALRIRSTSAWRVST